MGKFFLLFIVVFFALEALSSGTMSSEYKNRANDEFTTGTSQDDMDGITALISAFEQLKEYRGGDPCGSLTIWPWLLCTGTRVTYLDLSGYGLTGNLPDFSKMDALEMIYMSNNDLDGPIPDFLGKLPSLTYLDLSNNQFSGKIPKSITSKTSLYYNVAGNPDLDLGQPKKKNKALIVGLAVGIPVAIAIKVLVIAFVVYSRRQRQQQQQQQQQAVLSQGQAFAFVPGGTPHGQSSIDIGSMSMSTEPMGRPSNAMENISGATNGQNVPTAPPMVYGVIDQSHPVNPNVRNNDDDEIAELLRQHGAHGGS